LKKLNKFFLADLHTKAKKEGYIEGMASTWNKDLGGDKIEQGAFSDTIPNFMGNPVMLFSHQMDKPIGKWTNLVETDRGLEVSGEINLKTSMGKDVYQLVSDNDVKGLSIGYSIEDSEAIGDTNVLKKLNLWEISIVAIPMNQQAWLTGAKMFESTGDLITQLDDNAKWEETAGAMVSLLSNRFAYKDLDLTQKKAEYDYISKWYGKFEKKPPVVDFSEDIKFKDIEFLEDEKYLSEVKEFKNNISKITDIVEHWKKSDRELPKNDLTGLYELIAKRFHSVGKELEASQLKKVQSIQKLSVKVENLISAIENEATRKAAILNQVDLIVKEALYKATGKRI
jgi:hypothetical protein